VLPSKVNSFGGAMDLVANAAKPKIVITMVRIPKEKSHCYRLRLNDTAGACG